MPRPKRERKNNKGALGVGSSAPQYCLSPKAYCFIDSVKYVSVKKLWKCSSKNGHQDVGVCLRGPRRAELVTEVPVPARWKTDSVPIHNTNNILHLLGTRPFEVVVQRSKATIDQWLTLPQNHTHTRVPSFSIFLGHDGQGSAMGFSSENTNL